MLALAIAAAKEAGRIQLLHFGSGEFETKGHHANRVTAADKEAEARIVGMIRERFPDHDVVGEEAEYEKKGSSYVWYVDPVDGTNNFAHGIPVFCVSIALVKDGMLELGVVYDVTRDEMFTAERGKGAFLNGERLHVSGATRVQDSIGMASLHFQRPERAEAMIDLIGRFLEAGVRGVRRFGAIARDLAWLAAGRGECCWHPSARSYDYAAGALLVREAGGMVTDWEGKEVSLDRSSLVASNGKFHQRLLEMVR